MATVFAFNAPSLAFFHKNEFSADSSCPDGDDVDYLILSKKVQPYHLSTKAHHINYELLWTYFPLLI